MKKIIFVLCGVLVLLSCNNQYKEFKNQKAVVVSTVDFENEAVNLVDQKIALEGTVTHVCKNGGKRFFLGEENIKVLASDKVGSFESSLEGSDVIVEGVLREERVDEAFLIEWEAELEEAVKAQEKEFAHKGEFGYEEAEVTEAESEDPNAATRKQIQTYRNQLAESGKEYLSFFTVEALKLKEKK